MASAHMAEAGFDAGAGRFEEARTSLRQAAELLEDVALVVWLAGPYAQLAGWVELLAGEPAARGGGAPPGLRGPAADG